MGEKSDIEWCDSTWNPIQGCSPASEGCQNCYARGIAERFKGTKAYPDGFKVSFHPERLQQPLKWKKPRKVFVCSMGDLFHDDVKEEWIHEVLTRMGNYNHHTYFVLTKRPERMEMVLDKYTNDFPELMWPHIWFGVSVEDNASILRIATLMSIPGINRFVSFEPLLEVLNEDRLDLAGANGVDWMIVGAETGSKARVMPVEAAFQLCEFADVCDIPFFFKKWGKAGVAHVDMPREFPDFEGRRKG